jgi:predicted ATP-grasp superfamily ATP-dependent carboligase
MGCSVNPAILVGGGGGNGLSIARNLGQQGIDVYAVVGYPHEVVRYSKYCTGIRVIPGVEANPAALQRFLHAFAPQFQGIGVLFPTSDNATLTLAQLRPSLTKYATYVPERAVVETMVVKTKFYQAVRATGIPHPLTLFPDEDSPQSMVRKLAFPVFIRPAQSQVFHRHFHRKGFIASTAHELRMYLRAADRAQVDVMVQEIIPGPATNGYVLRGYLDQTAQLIVLFVTLKVRQPNMFSNPSIDLTVPLAEVKEFDQTVIAFLRQQAYRGLFGAEFKLDPRDGQYKLLEVNARSTGGNYIGVIIGANDVLAAYHDMLGKPLDPIMTYEMGIHYFDGLAYDVVTMLYRAIQRRLTRHELRPYVEKPYLNYLVRDDPLPFFIELMGMLYSKSFLDYR